MSVNSQDCRQPTYLHPSNEGSVYLRVAHRLNIIGPIGWFFGADYPVHWVSTLVRREESMRDAFFVIGRGPFGRGKLSWLASLAWLKSASRPAISWLHPPTFRLKSVSWLAALTD